MHEHKDCDRSRISELTCHCPLLEQNDLQCSKESNSDKFEEATPAASFSYSPCAITVMIRVSQVVGEKHLLMPEISF